MVRAKRGDLVNTKKKDPRFLRNNNIPVGFTKEMYDKVTDLADARHLSKSKLIEVIVTEYLEREGF